MAEFPEQALSDIDRGDSFYRKLLQERKTNLRNGCTNCRVKNFGCLKNILLSLHDKVELEEYDDVAIRLMDKMLIIIGDFVAQVGPTVNAGPDKNVSLGSTTDITAVITPGTSPIATIQWTKLSGGDVTMSGANTATLTISDYDEGEYIFQIKIVDENAVEAIDTMKTVVSGAMALIRFGLFPEQPVAETVVFTEGINVPVDSSIYQIDFGPDAADSNNYAAWDEPVTEPVKLYWQIIPAINYGTIPDFAIVAPVVVGDRRVYISRSFLVFEINVTTLKASSNVI